MFERYKGKTGNELMELHAELINDYAYFVTRNMDDQADKVESELSELLEYLTIYHNG